jgi:hypothetical protein
MLSGKNSEKNNKPKRFEGKVAAMAKRPNDGT